MCTTAWPAPSGPAFRTRPSSTRRRRTGAALPSAKSERMMTLRIPYKTDGFPPGTIANGSGELSVTWDDVLWAAVTLGRPNRHYVFRHGDASLYEALFRWS